MKLHVSHAWLQSFFDTTLPEPTVLGAALQRHAFEIEAIEKRNGDTRYEIDITPNRAVDCLSHYGIAKEIAAIYTLPLQKRYFTEPYEFERTEQYIETELCDRYALLRAENCTLKETPPALRAHLEAIGIQCISPLVDLANGAMLEFGQPIHVFDATAIQGAIRVRQAHEGEQLLLIGGETITLTPEDIVIADEGGAIALAGIKGGQTTAVTEQTTALLIEIGTFDAVSVRRSARRLGLSTAAAQRFSQGYPKELISYTTRHVAELFAPHTTLTASSEHRRVQVGTIRTTGVSLNEITTLLGSEWSQQDVADLLSRLAFTHEYSDPRERFLEVARAQVGTPYKWGASVVRDAPKAFDCSSYICYCAAKAGKSIPRMAINQYLSADPVRDPEPGDLVFFGSKDTSLDERTEAIKEAGYPVSPGKTEVSINHVGILESETTILEAEGSSGAGMVKRTPLNSEVHLAQPRRIFDGEKRFIVTIPVERPDIGNEIDLIEELARLRGYDTIAPALQKGEEIPPVEQELAKRMKIAEILRSQGYFEVITTSFAKKGAVTVIHPVAKDRGALREQLRDGLSEAREKGSYHGELLGRSEVVLFEIGTVFSAKGETVHLAITARETLGRAKLSYEALEKKIQSVLPLPGGFKEGVWEVPLEAISLSADEYPPLPTVEKVHYHPPSLYPFVLRDLAVFVPDEEQTAEQTKMVIEKQGGDLLVQVNHFDSFKKGEALSHAFRLVFQSPTETLTDERVTTQMEHITKALEAKGYTIR